MGEEEFRIRESEAYAEGRNARMDGKGEMNPYQFQTVSWWEWQQGWEDTDKDLIDEV